MKSTTSSTVTTTTTSSSVTTTTTSPTSTTNKLIVAPFSLLIKKQEFDQPIGQYEIRKNIFEFLTRIRSDEHRLDCIYCRKLTI